MGQWINSDGLVIRLGTTEGEVTRGGEFEGTGPNLRWEFVIDLANLGSASAILEDTQDIVFPKNLLITKVSVFNEVAATGSGATLNLGFNKQDRTTALNVDGLLAVAPRTDWASAGAVKEYILGVTGIGDQVGTALSEAGVLVADYDTAAFTAGRIRVVVEGEIARPSPSNA